MFVYATSSTQKLNIRSLILGGFFADDDVLQQILWTHMRLLAQGYSSSESVIYKDNQRVILLQKTNTTY